VKAGQCAALNVPQWEHHAIQRGHTVATSGYFSPQPLYACTLRLLPREKLAPRTHGTLPLKSGVRVKLHTGTSEVIAAVYPMQGTCVRAGEEVLVQVKMETPVIAAPGDRFVLRALSPVQTIGGGTVIEALSRRLKRNRVEVLNDLRQRAEAVHDDKQFVEYCLRTADAMAVDESRLSLRAKLTRDRLKAILDELMHAGKVLCFSRDLYIHHDTATAAGWRIVDILGDFHRTSPETPGLSLDQLQQASQFDRPVLKGPVLKGIVSLLKTQGRLVERSKRLALAEHLPTFQEEDIEHLEAIESLFRQSAFHPPVAEELAEKTGASADTVQRIVKILVENERLVRVAENLLFHQTAVDRARDILVSFIREEGELESVRFKYLLDTTRKFAIPMLDYFDRIGVTRRSGNTRYLKTPPS
jgi:selenocysteine-specific elongation factor